MRARYWKTYELYTMLMIDAFHVLKLGHEVLRFFWCAAFGPPESFSGVGATTEGTIDFVYRRKTAVPKLFYDFEGKRFALTEMCMLSGIWVFEVNGFREDHGLRLNELFPIEAG